MPNPVDQSANTPSNNAPPASAQLAAVQAINITDTSHARLIDALPSANLSRRGFLSTVIAASAAASITPSLASASSSDIAPPAQPSAPALQTISSKSKVRNIILMVADGTSNGALALAEQFSRITKGSSTNWMALSKSARRAVVSTHPADGIVTDSAAASSAWSTGVKHRNGTLCISPTGEKLTPILARVQASGRSAGVVTTTTLAHATPAGFYAIADDRTESKLIAKQLLARKLDVALGGGNSHFSAEDIAQINDLVFTSKQSELSSFDPRSGNRLLGSFSTSHIPMVLDRSKDHPSLELMAARALQTLEYKSANNNGFFLQIEGGRVDHAAHANDAAGILTDLLEFDRTIQTVANFVAGRNDTLLIVTTDHATANPGLTFYGRHGLEACKKLANVKHSFEWIFESFAANVPSSVDDQVASLVDLTKQATSIDLGTDAREAFKRRLQGNIVDPSIRRNELTCILGSALGNSFGVQFVSPDHTADLVDLFAIGPHAESLPSSMDNTDLFGWMTNLLAIPTS